MRTRLFAALLVAAVGSVAAAQEENPFKKTKVGDYATYKVVTKVAGQPIEGTLTQTVTAKDDKEATVTTTGKVGPMDIQPYEQKIDLSKPYDPTKTGNIPPGSEVKVEKLTGKGKEGTEKVKAGGKDQDCKYETFKLRMKTPGAEFDADMKVWTSAALQIPMVKMEMSAQVEQTRMDITMELTESGNKPVEAPKTPDKK